MRRLLLMLSVSLLAWPASTQATVLLSQTLQQGGTQANGFVTSLSFAVGPQENAPYTTDAVFDNIPFTLGDVGVPVTVTSATDPNFNAVASALTNGQINLIVFTVATAPVANASGQALPDSLMIYGNTNDPRVDLQGDTINSFSLVVDKLTITDDATTNSSSYNVTYTFSVNGTPEPASAGLVFSGLLLCGRRRKI